MPTPQRLRQLMRTSRRDGFTLIEVSFGLAIIGIIAVSVMATIVTCSKSQNYHRERAIAREAARSKMEEVLAWREFQTLVETFDNTTFDAGTLITGDFEEVVVKEGEDPPDPVAIPPGMVDAELVSPYLARVTVRVEWESPARGMQDYEVTTMVADAPDATP